MKTARKSDFSTINANEVSHFAQDSADWWTLDGPFAPLHRITPTRMRYLKSVIGDVKGKTILDIGCGGGLISVPLTRLGAKVTGIDADVQAIEVAQQHSNAQGLTVQFIHGAAEDLVKQGKTYDVVMALEVIEHVDNPSLFVELCAQLVKPNGTIIFSTLNRTWKSYAMGIIAAERLLRWVPVGTHDWHKFIKPSELARMAENAGLILRSAKGMVYNPRNNSFSVHPHDLDVNYFMVATAPPNKVK